MTIQTLLDQANIAKLDAELIIAHVLDTTRSWVIAHVNDDLDGRKYEQIQKMIARREQCEPLAYIVQRKEFYGRDFFVNNDVLIPRPSTEILIETVKNYLQSPTNKVVDADTQVVIWSYVLQKNIAPIHIVDIGTGSGCIGITMSLECQDIEVTCTDIDPKALEVCTRNIASYNLEKRVKTICGNLLEPLANFTQPFLVISNPPYIPPAEVLMKDVGDFEPTKALFGKEKDGGDIVRKLVAQATQHPFCTGYILECRAEHVSL